MEKKIMDQCLQRIEIKFAVVKAQGRRPHAAAVLRFGKTRERRLPRENVADYRPVYEVSGMQHGQARNLVKARRHQVKIRPDANNVGVGIIGVQDGVLIRPVALIGYPNLRNRTALRQQERGQQGEK